MISFIDDILVYSKSEHKDNLRMILGLLKKNQLYAKYFEHKFWFSFLGHIVSKEWDIVDPQKVKAVKN